VQQRARENPAGIAERLTSAAGSLILECWASLNLWDQGMGYICLSRELPNGSIAVAIFLVDRYCLGVKNALAQITSRFNYESRTRQLRSQSKSKNVSPANARKFVESSVEYAEALGLHPHADYQKAKLLFGDIDASQATESLEFGKDGKPFFIAGPHDSPQRCRTILTILEGRCGPDGYHFLLPRADPREVLPDSLKRKGTRVIGRDAEGVIRDQADEFFGDPSGPASL
jgi:hypothetical protein